MSIYRGVGGSVDATNDAIVAEVTAAALTATTKAAEAATSASQAAQTATVYTTEVYTGVQESLVTMASNIISTQTIVVEHHAFS